MKVDIVCLSLKSGTVNAVLINILLGFVLCQKFLLFHFILFFNIYFRILQEAFFYAVLGTTKEYFRVYLLIINHMPTFSYLLLL